jgi:hypothetical protein
MNEIFDSIKCVNCRNWLDSPVLLPCGCSICHKHTCNQRGQTILCCSCEIEHQLPPNGEYFPTNRNLAHILESQISALNFGQAHIEAKESCSRLDELLTEIEHVLNDPFNFIYEAIEHLKYVDQLKVEEMKLNYDENLAILISQLDEFKETCKCYLKTSKYLAISADFKRRKEDARQELDKNVAILNELKLNKPEWKKIKNKSEMTIESLETELEKFKVESLLRRRFEMYRGEVEKKIGKFEIHPDFKFRY